MQEAEGQRREQRAVQLEAMSAGNDQQYSSSQCHRDDELIKSDQPAGLTVHAEEFHSGMPDQLH